MNFSLDLLDAVADEEPGAVRGMVQQAAEHGHHLVVCHWLEHLLEPSGGTLALDLGADDAGFVNAMLKLASHVQPFASSQLAGRNAFGQSPAGGNRASSASAGSWAFGQWARAALGGRPERLSELLSQCLSSPMAGLDGAARQLLALGADPLAPIQPDASGAVTALAGVKLALSERSVSLLARAISHQHPLTSELMLHASSAKTAWPVVAEVGTQGAFYPVNAAGYAIALGDVKMLRAVCDHSRADDQQMGLGLSLAIEFALTSGLTSACTPEVAQCIAVCIANGADLEGHRLGARLAGHRATLAPEVSCLALQGDPSYSIGALFISARTGGESLAALSRLITDYQLDINGPVTQGGSRASLLHYAAASGHKGLVEGLIKLGADTSFVDAKGLSPAAWAQVFDRQGAAAVLDPRAQSAEKTEKADGSQRFVELSERDSSALWQSPGYNEQVDDVPWQGSGHAQTDQPISLEEFTSHHHDSQSVTGSNAGKKPEPAAPVVLDRTSIAATATAAQASRGAALFSKLKQSQAIISAKAIARNELSETQNNAPQADGTFVSGRLAFRGRA